MTLTVHKGTDLPKADLIGKIDAYVRVIGHAALLSGSKELARTKVIKKDYNPSWQDKFTFVCSTKEPLRLVLMDWDAMSKDDEMGRVDVPIAPCDNAKLKLELLGKKTKPSSGSESCIYISMSIGPPTGGIFALAPSVMHLSPTLVCDEYSATILVNTTPLCNAGFFIAFTFDMLSTKVRVSVMRTEQERKFLACLSIPGGMSGVLHTGAKAEKRFGKDVYEYWEPVDQLDLATTDWTKVAFCVYGLKMKKSQTHLELAKERGITLTAPPPVNPDPAVTQAQFAEATRDLGEGVTADATSRSLCFAFHKDYAKAEYKGSKATTSLAEGKQKKRFVDVTRSQGTSNRIISFRAGGGEEAGMDVGASCNYADITHSLYKRETLCAIPLPNFCVLKQ